MAIVEQRRQTVTEAAVTVNTVECLSAILILTAHIADAWIGSFKVVAFGTPSTILGLVVLALYTSSFSSPLLLYVCLVLLMVGKASYNPPLKGFLADQLNRPVDNLIHIGGSAMLRLLLSSWVGVLIISTISAPISWQIRIFIFAIMMGIAYIQFWCGHNVYSHKGKRHGNPLTLLCNRLKAAILRTVPNTLQEQEEAEESKRVKQLIALVPMCTCFIVLGLVLSTGNTFYTMQVRNKFQNDIIIVLCFPLLKEFTSSAVSVSCKFFISKYWRKNTRSYQHAILLKIGTGMLFCVLCCVTAWRVEGSILGLWLIPQFFLLGVMDGIAVGGLAEFFKANVDKSIGHYEYLLNKCVWATGKLLGTVLILLNPTWFGADIETSHLDRYFLLLLMLSAVNLLYYVLVAYKYVSSSSVDLESPSSVDYVSSSNVDLEVDLA